ncbi:glycosyltransferase family 4 protein [Streptomyces reniochalinae]|uniref:D-inositol 3-phosphate glycosyltransferase n=1 Tax=Streptomyces reniochalinae TaxID=2250578 RepID=A0A367F2M5_9ACTN|nr:glycosyltransferase family 4 protein [Streptomyces reniochalinae]RCG24628.1 glycosyltransferase family 4 protein [Streptomyces reniochalinae]
MKIVFLLDNAYGIGGTIRSTVNLSGALADRHQVEVVSLRRSRQEPALSFDPRVRLTSLIDLRRSSPAYDGDDPAYHQRSERFTEGHDHFERGISTRLGDLRIKALLENLDADVVIGTRPKINDYLAAYGTRRYVRIGQEHLTHRMHSDHIRTHQDAALAHLDGFVTVSYADAAAYRAALPDVRARIVCVPNAVPPADVEPSDGQAKLIVAAGRLIKVKRYDRLLRAFALVADKHPDWSLRLYGRGPQRDALRRTLDGLGLSDRAFMMGAHSPIETEWAKGSIAAVSSDGESFGMTLVEAMHCGVPVVSTDCPYGPGEIIANGRDGLLAPLGENEDTNVHAYADALLHLVEDPALRTRMGHAAREKAARYSPRRIAGEYEELMEGLLAERRGTPGGTGPTAHDTTRQATGGAAGDAAPDTAQDAATGPGAGQGADRPSGEGAGAAPRTGAPTAPLAPAPRGARSRTAPRGARARALRAARRVVPRALVPALRPLARILSGTPRAGGSSLPRPLARVRAQHDGALLFRLRATTLPRSTATLSLRPRGRDGTAPVRLPLPPREQADADGWVEVRLSRQDGPSLREARWDAYVERASDGRSKRVKAEQVETARLLSMPAPVNADGHLEPWIPYVTEDGCLAVRVWSRDRHAEVTGLVRGEHGYALTARLYGQGVAPELSRRTVELSGGPVLVAVPRGGNPRQAFEFPGRRGTEADTVELELPYELPAAFADGAAEGVWDLWLRPGLGPDRVRLGRLLGDLADRKKTDVTPRTRLGESNLAVQLYFSLNNNLVLTLKTLTAPRADDHTAPAATQPATPAAAQHTAPATTQHTSSTAARHSDEELRQRQEATGTRQGTGSWQGSEAQTGARRHGPDPAAGSAQGRSSSPSASASA